MSFSDLASIKKNKHILNKFLGKIFVPDNLKKPIVMISMGEKGRSSRLMVGDRGSLFTFAYVGDTSAPGQIELEEMFEELSKEE